MYKCVALTINGRQHGEKGEDAVTELCVTAQYTKRDDSHYFLYEETLEESEAVIHNTLKLKGGVLELVKRGAVSARMVFDAGRSYLSNYATPYGCLQMDLHTDTLETVFLEEIPKEILVTYSLSSDGRPFAECSLSITVLWN